MADELTQFWWVALQRVGLQPAGAGPRARWWYEHALTFGLSNAQIQAKMKTYAPKLYARVQAEAIKLRILK